MVFLALAIGLYAFLFFIVPDLGDPSFKTHFSTIPMTARLHIIPGGIALVLGAFQFHPGLRKRWINLHRYSGRIYVTAVLLGSIGGLLLGWYAQRSPATRLGFSTLAVFWFYSGMMAYLAIRSGNIKLHQQWMIRSYALTLAGVTLRVQLGVFQGVFELGFDESYDIVAWFCWIPNLVVAEWLIIQSPLRKVAPA
jgi:uncharacterized membrane protein